MKKFGVTLLGALCTLWLLAGAAFAQSSGNFSAQIDDTTCTLNTSTGVLSPECSPTENGTECVALTAPIKISNGNGTALLVTPSMVTGLFTNTKVDTTVDTASADVGVQVCVTVTPDGSNTPVPGAVLGGDSNGCVVYDQRFQSVSSQLFSQLSECTQYDTQDACTPGAAGDDYCTTTYGSGYSCDSTTNTCVGPNPNCNLQLILSTLSAHSYNFIVNVPGGNYDIHAAWSLIGVSTSPSGKPNNASVAACAGPGTLTVTQTKVFNNSGSITTTN
jgi:hypothetical protein